jgi:hypothetical protein
MIIFSPHSRISFAVITWLGLIILSSAVAPQLLTYRPSFVDAQLLESTSLPHWLSAFANFDGVHYLTLATRGYLAVGYIQAFFPVYPLLLAAIGSVGKQISLILVGGMILSLISLLISLKFSRTMVQFYWHNQHIFELYVLLLLFFPTSFFFAGAYTESLFLTLVVGSFVAAAKKRWWLAGLLAAVVSGTRVVGIMLLPALVIELAAQTHFWRGSISRTHLIGWIWQQRKRLFLISLSALGLLTYCVFLWYYFHDPLYFFHVQSEFGGGRQETIILFPQVVWRYLKIFATVPLDMRYLIYLQEFFAAVGGLTVLLLGWKKVRFSLWFFSLAVLLVPTMTGTFSSMARYILVAPAIFMILADWLSGKHRLQLLWFLISIALLIFNTILFVQGYWVA